jgi:ComF family protein
MLRLLADLVAPPACASCAAPTRSGSPLCAPCRAELTWLHDPCPRCALPRPCGPPCPAANAAFDRAFSPLVYEGTARSLVASLKFKGRLAVADLMAAQIVANAPAGLLAGTLVAVPTAPRRRRARGFDQGELIARALGRRARLPVGRLLRRRDGTRQAGAGRATRLAGRIDVTVRGSAPSLVTLVDDVHTTGATLDRCAEALQTCGSLHIHAVTYARTLR